MNGNLAYQLELPEEIIGGQAVDMAPARTSHNRICRHITAIFEHYLRGRKCEYFADGEGLYLEEDKEEYLPDGMVVCDPEKVTEKGVIGAPDLVVEVLSPSTERYDRGHKMEVYQRCGVREYWLVSPFNRSLEQYVLENGRFVLRDIYYRYTGAELADMKEKDRAKIVTEFPCAIFEDLIIRIADVFGRVVTG